MRRVFLAVLALLLFFGCAKKEFFKPKEYSLLKYSNYTSSYLIDRKKEGATFENGDIITTKGLYKMLPKITLPF